VAVDLALSLMPVPQCGAQWEEKTTPRSVHPQMRLMRAAIETRSASGDAPLLSFPARLSYPSPRRDPGLASGSKVNRQSASTVTLRSRDTRTASGA
jgi:hypothetical protein